jgi:DNA-binding response OmpR family regulator
MLNIPATDPILVIEDDPHAAAGITAMLDLLSIEATVAPCGGDGLRALQSGTSFRALILDCDLPDINGPDVYRQIQPEQPDLPVIFVSGQQQPSVVAEFLAPGRVTFLAKPFTLNELERTLRMLHLL